MQQKFHQYLDRYAEPEAHFADNISEQYQHVIVVPVCNESLDVIENFKMFLRTVSPSVLIVFVINQPADRISYFNSNLNFYNQFCDVDENSNNLFRVQSYLQHGIIAIDRFTKTREINKKHGVGLARKIGTDFALKLIVNNHVVSPWIHCTDADVILPPDYLDIYPPDNVGAVCYAFQHINSGDCYETYLNTLLYELSLHSYVCGLSLINSKYAYHTIGSTIAIKATALVAVRGFPKRAAAEDFYLLNKVAKITKVKQLSHPKIQISSRVSNRVPFGTGPAVDTLLAQPEQANTLFYPKQCFVLFNEYVQAFERGLMNKNHQGVLATLNLPATIRSNLIKQIDSLYLHYAEYSDRRSHFHQWLDGGKTLQIINHLRNTQHSGIGLSQWLKESAEFIGFECNTPRTPEEFEKINSSLFNYISIN